MEFGPQWVAHHLNLNTTFKHAPQVERIIGSVRKTTKGNL
jgi:hypothetical protein